jgi:DNA-binding NtrC family response regulator
MQVSTVLVVDGDRATRDALVTCLKFVGVEAHGAENAAAARFWLATGIADVLVLSDELADGAPADIVVHSEFRREGIDHRTDARRHAGIQN